MASNAAVLPGFLAQAAPITAEEKRLFSLRRSARFLSGTTFICLA